MTNIFIVLLMLIFPSIAHAIYVPYECADHKPYLYYLNILFHLILVVQILIFPGQKSRINRVKFILFVFVLSSSISMYTTIHGDFTQGYANWIAGNDLSLGLPSLKHMFYPIIIEFTVFSVLVLGWLRIRYKHSLRSVYSYTLSVLITFQAIVAVMYMCLFIQADFPSYSDRCSYPNGMQGFDKDFEKQSF